MYHDQYTNRYHKSMKMKNLNFLTTIRFTLIGTVVGFGYDCTLGRVSKFENQTDGIWNKVSEHMEWVEKQMKEMDETVCFDKISPF